MSRMRHLTLTTCSNAFRPPLFIARAATMGVALGVSLGAQTAIAQSSSSSAREMLDRQLDLATAGIEELTSIQKEILGERWPLDA